MRFSLQVRYPVDRLHFSKVSDRDVSFFESVLSSSRVLSAPSDVQNYNIDFLSTCRGESQFVLRPKTTEEVAAILSYCNENRLAVCPQGLYIILLLCQLRPPLIIFSQVETRD